MNAHFYTGRCLCGAVAYEVDGPVEPPVACHCRECQRHSGGVWIAVTAKTHRVRIARQRLAWVSVSPSARRGFCRDCGGFLFWEPMHRDEIDIAFGSLDDPRGLSIAAHIFVAESRFPLAFDGVPRFDGALPETGDGGP